MRFLNSPENIIEKYEIVRIRNINGKRTNLGRLFFLKPYPHFHFSREIIESIGNVNKFTYFNETKHFTWYNNDRYIFK